MKRGRDEQPPGARRPGPPVGNTSAPRPGQGASALAAGSQKLTTNDALSYLREVKNRFADRKQVYDTFLDIMKEFKAQRIDTSGVIVRVKQLFKGHRELILGFNTFLPKGYEIELARISDDEEETEQERPKQAVEFDQAINYVNKIKNRFSNDERVYKAFLEILNMYRKGQKNINMVYQEVAVLFQFHDDLLHEFTYFLPDTQGQVSQQMRAHMRGQGGGPGPMMMGAGGMRGPGGMPMAGRGMARPGQGMPVGAMHGSALDHTRKVHQRKAARRAEEGFRRMDEEDGGMYPGMPGRGARSALTKEMQFLEKVKTRLRSRELYSDFLKCLNMYSQEIITRSELIQLTADILGRNPDLMGQFHQFVANCESMDISELHGQAPGVRGGQPLSNRDLLKAKLQKEKYMTKPLSEIVGSEAERVTPSYVPIPIGYPKLQQTGRTPLGDEVLNDQYVNVITGSEDYSFKLMRKNQYEEALFRCEDDRYEFDMACEQNMSAIRVLRPIAEQLEAMSPDEKAAFSWHDVQGINAVHLGHVAKLYADQGQTLLELLQKNPSVAIPVVLQRLEAKEREWRKIKEEMIPVWKKIYEQNYPRSLDHRSFYFKQAEKKCMMTKFMVSEVKEAADRRKGDDKYLRTLSMAHRHAIPAAAAPQPDLAFTYLDRDVFEDVYMAIHTAVEFQLHPGTKDQVELLYVKVIEPFLGLSVRQEEVKRLMEQADDGIDKEGDVDMADMKSDSSDAAAVAGGDGGAGEEVQGPGGSGKNTPAPESTPEPGMDDKQGSGGDQNMDGDDEKDEANGNGQPSPIDSSTDEIEVRTYSQCKPIMPYFGTHQPCVKKEESGTSVQGEGTRVLFGNENIYVFFRYHRYLYDRLCLARKFSLEVATKKATQPQRGGGPLGLSVAEAEARAQTPEAPSEAAIKEDAERIHASFLTCLREMLSNPGSSSDVGAFEDQVRNLLGTNSYELFTLDKLLTRLVKHMALMVSDDHTAKLWEMYQYEASRTQPLPLALYHVNAHTVLDDTCYRIEYNDSDNSIHFQQNDADRSDQYLQPEGAIPSYVLSYINSAPPAAGPSSVAAFGDNRVKNNLFLRRNLPPATREQPDDALVSTLSEFMINNALETKIACTTFKVSYVLDTEDLLVRKRRKIWDETISERRNNRFESWLAAQEELAKRKKKEDLEVSLDAARLLASASGLEPMA